MVKGLGLWIDHREARIVNITDDGFKLIKIPSNAEKRVRAAGGSRSSTPYGPQDVFAEDQVFRRFQLQLAAYYNQVIDLVKDAEHLLVLGPGEAKKEFCRQMKKSKELARIICTLEPADKMTDRQVMARVREFFGIPTSAARS
jgi:stalled ribosome rescue protein Dom34